MPEYGMGYWQCKLRYRTQEELLSVAREMKRRGLPLDAIVVDFFHWTRQGDFRFEPRDWPNPQAMVDELKAMGVETVVSVWPTIDEKSVNFGEMAERGLLVTADRGNAIVMTWMGNTFFFDGSAGIRLGAVQEELLPARHPLLLAGRVRAGIRAV